MNKIIANQAQYNQALSQYDTFKSKMEALGYTAKEEKQIVKLSDSDYFADRKDFKLIQLLLGQIADNTEENIDGMFNLPEGAAFYVNLAAAKMHTDTVNAISDGNIIPADDGVAAPTDESKLPQNMFGPGEYDMSYVLEMLSRGREAWKKYIDESSNIGSATKPVGIDKTAPELITGYSSGGLLKSKEDSQEDIGLKYTGGAENLGVIIGNAIRSILSGSAFGGESKVPTDGGLGSSLKDISAAQSTQNISTKFDINFESHTQLLVDGRVLASIIKPYLSSDLVQTQQTQSTITRRYVI